MVLAQHIDSQILILMMATGIQLRLQSQDLLIPAIKMGHLLTLTLDRLHSQILPRI